MAFLEAVTGSQSSMAFLAAISLFVVISSPYLVFSLPNHLKVYSMDKVIEGDLYNREDRILYVVVVHEFRNCCGTQLAKYMVVGSISYK